MDHRKWQLVNTMPPPPFQVYVILRAEFVNEGDSFIFNGVCFGTIDGFHLAGCKASATPHVERKKDKACLNLAGVAIGHLQSGNLAIQSIGQDSAQSGIGHNLASNLAMN